METLLLEHPLGGLITGQLFQGEDEIFAGLEPPDFGATPPVLSSEQVARLFMAPDESIVRVLRLAEQADGSPAGFSVCSDTPFVQPGQPVEVIAYRSENGAALQVSNLDVCNLLLDSEAPKRPPKVTSPQGAPQTSANWNATTAVESAANVMAAIVLSMNTIPFVIANSRPASPPHPPANWPRW